MQLSRKLSNELISQTKLPAYSCRNLSQEYSLALAERAKCKAIGFRQTLIELINQLAANLHHSIPMKADFSQMRISTNDPQLCDERNWGTQCFRLDEYTKKNECIKRATMPAYSKTAVRHCS